MSFLENCFTNTQQDMSFVFKMIVFPFWLLTAFLALMLK